MQKCFLFLSSRLVFFSLISVLSASANAGGLSITELSVTGVGSSNALTANIREPGAIPYNPSLGVFHSQQSASGNLMVIRASTAVTPENGTHTESEGRDNTIVPGLSVNLPFDQKHAFVFNVNVPFAVETKWPVGTFPAAVGYLGGLAQPTESKLEVIRISPSVATKLTRNTAFALGFDHYRVRKIIFDAVAKQSELDGDGWGLNASLTQRITPQFTFGADYHSMGSIQTHGVTKVGANSFAARIDKTPLPWRLQLGFAWDVRDNMSLEFDFTRTGWSNYKTIEIESASPTLSQNYWHNNDAYRLGLEYRVNDRFRLRAGYSFDEASQGDDFFSARSPDSDRHLFGIGFGYDLAKDLTLDVGYMYALFEDRTFNSVTAPTTTDLNGTSAYNGLYETDVHIFGMSLTKRF